MKLTESQLRQIIRESLLESVNEGRGWDHFKEDIKHAGREVKRHWNKMQDSFKTAAEAPSQNAPEDFPEWEKKKKEREDKNRNAKRNNLRQHVQNHQAIDKKYSKKNMNESYIDAMIRESVKKTLAEGNWSNLSDETEKKIDNQLAWSEFEGEKNRSDKDNAFRLNHKSAKEHKNLKDHPEHRKDYVNGNEMSK